jgi:FMN hydrolase / 5-amino-6-(5-phospho-D-ribitylamino)uracil phosphatase
MASECGYYASGTCFTRMAYCHTIQSLARRFSSRDLRKLRDQLLLQHPHLACDFSTLRKMSLHHAAERVGYRTEFVEQALEIFLEARHEVTLYHDVLPTLEALHGRYRLSTLTNGNADVNRLPLAAWFDCNIQACHIGVAKPAVEPFHAICKMTRRCHLNRFYTWAMT